MRRFKQQLEDDECRAVLRKMMRGALSLPEIEGYPYAIPIDYYYDEKRNVIMFHGALTGKKTEALKEGAHVCFTLWDDGYKKKNDWAYTVRSVIIFGTVHIADTQEELEDVLRKIGRKYYPTFAEADEAMDKYKARAMGYWMTIDHITGKTVHEE